MQSKMGENLDTQPVWHNVLESIKVSVSDAMFRTWFKDTSLVELNKAGDRYVATIGCSSSYVKTQIESRYFGLLQDTLSKELSAPCDLLFTIASQTELIEKTNGASPLFDEQPDFSKEEFEESLRRANIRPSYNFENFAVSSSNQMAHAACEAVSRDPGKAYNPLFIWGGVGVGKTHIMSAVAYSLIKKDSKLPVHLCTGEQFTNDIVEGIRNKSTSRVRDKYRKLNVLLVDDIQFIAGKDTVQEEFFHTFNAVTGAGGQVIMTSDRPPGEIAKLEERLRSRFEAGLIVDIAPLDFELRCAICFIKAKDRGVELDSQLVSMIAGNVTSARQIEGYLTRLIAQAQIKNAPITVEMVQALLGTTIEEVPQIKATPDEVIKAACKYFTVLKRDLLGPRRARPLSLPRQMVMYFLRKELGLPFEEVGRIIGRDHTTVMHAVEKISTMASKDVNIREDLVGIKNSLSG